jgi:Transposase DDE domain
VPRGLLAADRYLGAAGQAPSRVRGPDGWTGPCGLAAGFGRDAAHAEWFYGFRLAARTGLGSRIVRGRGIVPAAVNEREVADDLLDGIRPPAGLLLDRGFTGRAFAARHSVSGTAVVLAHSRAQRHQFRKVQRCPVAALRNRIETSYGEITDRLELARHGAHTFWGLLTRVAATLAAHTLLRLHLI